jgi:nitrite reductase/ring-hydroxylating ferredoxin subunit/uncharacterized membrane protein
MSDSAASDSKPAKPKEPVLDRMAAAVQHVARPLTGATWRAPRRLKTLLSGSFLGHPLHPILKDGVVGAWLLTTILDILWLINGDLFAWAARAAQLTAMVGILSAFAAIATGTADWSDTYGPERHTGFIHGLLNASATLLYLVSLGLRYGIFAGHLDLSQHAAANPVAAFIGFGGFALMAIAAFLGGDLVYQLATGVNHEHFESSVRKWTGVGPLADVPEGKPYRVVAGKAPVVLLRNGEQIYAIGATCTHNGGPLDKGVLDGLVVECPWHQSRFDMRNGHVITGPATVRATRYDVRVTDGTVEVITKK